MTRESLIIRPSKLYLIGILLFAALLVALPLSYIIQNQLYNGINFIVILVGFFLFLAGFRSLFDKLAIENNTLLIVSHNIFSTYAFSKQLKNINEVEIRYKLYGVSAIGPRFGLLITIRGEFGEKTFPFQGFPSRKMEALDERLAKNGVRFINSLKKGLQY